MSLDDVASDWTRLGAEDPLWAVYVEPGTKNGGWDHEAFFATGRREVAASMARLEALGLPNRFDVALDFGAGVGRLSQPLQAYAGQVIGVDVSLPMLDEARRLAPPGSRIRFVHSTRPDLAFQPTASVDLVYSSLVLQHLPRALASGYLREFLRVLRPGGVAVVQVVSRPRATLRGLAAALLPQPVVGLLQTRLLGYPAPMRMTPISRSQLRRAVGSAGELADAGPDPSYGGHWVHVRYVVVRAVGPDAGSATGGSWGS